MWSVSSSGLRTVCQCSSGLIVRLSVISLSHGVTEESKSRCFQNEIQTAPTGHLAGSAASPLRQLRKLDGQGNSDRLAPVTLGRKPHPVAPPDDRRLRRGGSGRWRIDARSARNEFDRVPLWVVQRELRPNPSSYPQRRDWRRNWRYQGSYDWRFRAVLPRQSRFITLEIPGRQSLKSTGIW